jgi:flavin reductase (DIM6/NTAB) family NADH-FMN oxidoreductase RutF
MRIVIGASGSAHLETPSDFKRFSILLDAPQNENAEKALSGVVQLDGSQHAWVRPEVVRALSPAAKYADWEEGFRGMVDFASSKGWVNADGAIRAHIEYADGHSPISKDAFRSAMRNYASGVCVVACDTQGKRCGMTVSSFSSVSADPPMILVCINSSAGCHDSIVSADKFSVNILSEAHAELARTFAGATELHGDEKFGVGEWLSSPDSVPVLSDALQTLVCVPANRQRAGSHTVLIGRVVSTDAPRLGAPLVSFDGDLHSMERKAAIA